MSLGPGGESFHGGRPRATPLARWLSDEQLVNASLAILFEDAHCLAVCKPPGQFTLGTFALPGECTLEDAVRRYLNPGMPRSVYLGIVHRLDRVSSGVVLWAKTPKAARRLSQQFERRQVQKEYWAVVEAHPRPADPATDSDLPAVPRALAGDPAGEWIWSDWLTRAHPSGRVRVEKPGTPGAREAVTRVRRGAEVFLPPETAWLRLFPLTGRTHQLRAQAGARGMPILGDATYGARRSFGPPHAIALHARSLSARHPILGTALLLCAPLPEAWSSQGIVLS